MKNEYGVELDTGDDIKVGHHAGKVIICVTLDGKSVQAEVTPEGARLTAEGLLKYARVAEQYRITGGNDEAWVKFPKAEK